MKFSKRLILILIVLISCVGCDQATKSIAVSHLPETKIISYLGDTLRFQLLYNRGGFLSIPDTHNHVIDVYALSWSVELAKGVVIMEVEAPVNDLIDKSNQRNLVENDSKTKRAFILEAGGPPEWQSEYVYFQDLRTEKVIVILGIPLAHRPFSDLVWVPDRYLVFDRWSQPHYGIHYVVDTELRKLVLARPFPDQFFLDSQNAEQSTNNGMHETPEAGHS